MPLHWKNTVYIHEENKKKLIILPAGLGQRITFSDYAVVLTICGFESRQRQEVFLLSETSVLALWPIHPPMQWVRLSLLFPGDKGPERELNTLPSSAEVKNEWSCTSSSPMCLYGVTERSLIFYRYNPTRFIKGWKLVSFLREECKLMSIEEREI